MQRKFQVFLLVTNVFSFQLFGRQQQKQQLTIMTQRNTIVFENLIITPCILDRTDDKPAFCRFLLQNQIDIKIDPPIMQIMHEYSGFLLTRFVVKSFESYHELCCGHNFI